MKSYEDLAPNNSKFIDSAWQELTMEQRYTLLNHQFCLVGECYRGYVNYWDQYNENFCRTCRNHSHTLVQLFRYGKMDEFQLELYQFTVHFNQMHQKFIE